jgi:hypothetical protein
MPVSLPKLAHEKNCAVDLLHHTRKGTTMPGDADSGRGASSLKDGGRLVRTLTPMSSDDAKTFNISNEMRTSLVRIDNAKVNLTKRSANATWFRIVGVRLGNGTSDYPNGDEVQTVERWTPPDFWGEITTSVANQILDRIERGPEPGQRYSPAPQAKDRAAWVVIQEFCPSLNEKQAREVITRWLETGVLLKQTYPDPRDRHQKPGLFIGKRPGDTWEASPENSSK